METRPDDANEAEYEPARLSNGHVWLRPISPSDYDFLRAMELSQELGQRWRYRGEVPPPEEWVGLASRNAPVQFLVVKQATGEPLGIVLSYNFNLRDRHAYVAGARFDPRRKSPLFMLGFCLFIDYLFRNWEFRKLYADAAEYNFEQWRSARIFTLEGRLRDHTYWNGRYWDEVILSVSRTVWEQERGRLLL